MKRSIPAVLGAALVLTSATLPAQAATVPVPEHDAFYAVPANIASYADGAVISSRAITALAYLFPVPARSWQVKYRTNDSHGAPTATVTTIMVPKKAWSGPGPRPVLSYQTAEDGVAGKCAPSYALRAGAFSTQSNSEGETGLMSAGLSKGWAVVVPDYEGPQSQFLAGPLEGQAVLDGLRAVAHFAPAGLGGTRPLGIWGYSGGSIATSVAAQLQPSYAPDVHLTGIALGGLVGDIKSAIAKFSGSVGGGAIAMGVNGPMRAYPEFNLSQYLSPGGAAKVAAASGDCLTQSAARYPFLKISDIEAFPGAFNLPAVNGLLRSNSPLGIAGTPTAPVYDYHAIYDEFAPIGPDREVMQRYCAAGVAVQHVEDIPAEHISETVSGAPGALAFFTARFAGTAAKNTCATVPSP